MVVPILACGCWGYRGSNDGNDGRDDNNGGGVISSEYYIFLYFK